MSRTSSFAESDSAGRAGTTFISQYPPACSGGVTLAAPSSRPSSRA